MRHRKSSRFDLQSLRINDFRDWAKTKMSGATIEPLEERRLLAAGALDPTFGNAGTIKSEIDTYKLVALPNKQILVGERRAQPTIHGSFIQRQNENVTQEFSIGNTEATNN